MFQRCDMKEGGVASEIRGFHWNSADILLHNISSWHINDSMAIHFQHLKG